MRDRKRGLDYLETLPLWTERSHLALEVVTELLRLLGDPQNKPKSIHIAGTNGKGSVASYIAAMLQCQGYSVGLTTSPHLSDITERCVINGRAIDYEQFDKIVESVVCVAEKNNLTPTYFELGVVASFVAFANANVDWIVVEVGVGGRLDATNVLAHPEVCVITSIGFDHTALLGNTLRQIASEKAGIFKQGAIGVVGEVAEEARNAIGQIAAERSVSAEYLGIDFRLHTEEKLLESVHGLFSFPTGWMETLPTYQRKNAAVAVRVGQAIGLTDGALRGGLLAARWPGRTETIPLMSGEQSDFRTGPLALLDVAHNPEGVEALVDYLRAWEHRTERIGELTVIFGAMERKDWQTMLDLLAEFEDERITRTGLKFRWLFTAIDHPQAVHPQVLYDYLKRGEIVENSKQAIETARTLSAIREEMLTVITGSVILVGEARNILRHEPFSTFESQN